tara:strand:+ start:40 stop:576 length:537 start_codon:yes stop_codon:yes gene_type:complete
MILVKELLNVQIEKHPYSDDLNEKLLKDCENFNFIRDAKNIDGGDTNVKALQTSSHISSKSMELIQDWILNLLKQRFPGHSGGSTSGFTVINRWVARYNKGDYTRPHSHKPAFQSFVYFIKSPKGSSPLVFTNTKKKIQPVEGVVVLFDGVMRHHVPPNNCEDRVVLAGNIIPYYNIP